MLLSCKMTGEYFIPGLVQLNLRDVEHDEVLVEIVEVAGIPLIEVVGELCLGVIVGSNPRIEVGYTKGITVEHDTENTSYGLLVAGSGGDIDLGNGIESIVFSGTLPVRNLLSGRQLEVVLMEGVGVEVSACGGHKVRQHYNVKQRLRSKTCLSANIEQGGHFCHSLGNTAHLEGSVSDEFGVKDCLVSSQSFAERSIVTRKQIYCTGVACASNGSSLECIVNSFSCHVINGSHYKRIHLYSEGLVNLIIQHGNKCVQFNWTGEALLYLPFGDGSVDLEGDHLVEELCFNLRLMENVGIVACTISQIPAVVLLSGRHFRGDLHANRSVFPSVHKNGGCGTGVGPIHKNRAADPVHQGLDILIEGVCVENRVSNINNVGQVFGENCGIANCFLGCVVYKFVDLRYFHFIVPPQKFLLHQLDRY